MFCPNFFMPNMISTFVQLNQNNMKDKQIIFWEGWVKSCWEGLYIKQDYKGLSKPEAIEKIEENNK